MKRTLLRTLLMVLIIATASFLVVSCGDGSQSNKPGESKSSESLHEHVAGGEWQKNENQHWKVCADDGEKLEVADHTFGEWVTDKAATCTEKGKKHAECTVCGYKAEEEIAATGHDYAYTDNKDGTHSGVCKNDPTHVLEKQNHIFGKDFAGHDAEKHWKECTACGARTEGAHEFKLDGDSYACECGESMAVVAKDLYKVNSENEAERKTFEIDLKVKETNVLTEKQEIGAENFTVNLGETYNGKLMSVKFGRFELEGATLEGGVLTLPKDTFTAEDAGEQTVLCVVGCKDGVYKLTLHLTVATRVISTVEEWNALLRDPISLNRRDAEDDDGKSGVYGYYTIAGDIDFNHEALRDPAFAEGANTSSFAHKANQINGKIGFAGTFDGRGYALKNFNTANPFGLFLITDDKGAVTSTVKNLVVDGVWHDNGIVNANIFGHSIANVTFDNITINVEKTSLTGSLVSPSDGTLNGRGFICGAYANKNVYKNFTVNASGSTISALFGWWIKRSGAADDNGAIITCENFVVNAREITYWGRLDGNGDPAMTPTDYPMTGLTYNKDVINEIEITNNGNRFVVDLNVADTTKTLAEQVIGATGNIEIDLGEDYGTLVGVKFNGDKIEGATVAENKLIIPVTFFSAGAVGERDVEVTMQKDKAVNILSVKVLIVTKAITSATDFKENITDKTATYGYFVLANDIDFENTALTLPAWVQYPAHSLAWNDNTIYGSSAFFAGTFDGMGHKIKNYNTGSESDGGRYGLFGKIKNAAVKNVIFEDVVYTGKEFVNVLAFMAESSKFENITINVKSCAAPEKDIMTGQYGFIVGRKLQHSSFKDITVNAAGQEIYSLFGYWIMRNPKTNVKDGNYVACENVVVNAKKVHYWGRIDGETIGDAAKEAPMDVKNYPINGVTVNVVDSAA
mgnify:CR=1 FL=1